MQFGRGVDGVELDLFYHRAVLRRRRFGDFGRALADPFVGRVDVIMEQFLCLVAGSVDAM